MKCSSKKRSAQLTLCFERPCGVEPAMCTAKPRLRHTVDTQLIISVANVLKSEVSVSLKQNFEARCLQNYMLYQKQITSRDSGLPI